MRNEFAYNVLSDILWSLSRDFKFNRLTEYGFDKYCEVALAVLILKGGD